MDSFLANEPLYRRICPFGFFLSRSQTNEKFQWTSEHMGGFACWPISKHKTRMFHKRYRWFSRYVIAAMLVDGKQKIAH